VAAALGVLVAEPGADLVGGAVEEASVLAVVGAAVVAVVVPAVSSFVIEVAVVAASVRAVHEIGGGWRLGAVPDGCRAGSGGVGAVRERSEERFRPALALVVAGGRS